MIGKLEAGLKKFPSVGLGNYPTPLQRLVNLSHHLDGPRIWIKREDLNGLGCGGNKLRKLDRMLHGAREAGYDTLVSGGVVQSNSLSQVAAAAARLGLGCHLAVFHGRVDPPVPQYLRTGNALLHRLFGATLHQVE